MARHRGKVTFSQPTRGFGFIKSDAYSEQGIFCHTSEVEGGYITEGLWLEFDIVDGKNGKPQAIRCRRLTKQEAEIETAYEQRHNLSPVRYGS